MRPRQRCPAADAPARHASIGTVNDAWQDWLAQLPQDTARRAQDLRQKLADAGCLDPDGWARSEISDNIPQASRYRFLHQLWPQMIDGWHDGVDNILAAQRALEAGADRDDLVRLARAVAYDTVFSMLFYLDDDQPDEPAKALPSWWLSELDQTGNPTGRAIQGLYEDLLSLDPSGLDGRDLWT
jgi:hypothetical protein